MDVYVISIAEQPTFHHRSRYLRSAMSLRDVDKNSYRKSQFRITQYPLIPTFVRGTTSRNGEMPETLARHRENFAANKSMRGLYPRKNFLRWIYFTRESLRSCSSSWRVTTISSSVLRSSFAAASIKEKEKIGKTATGSAIRCTSRRLYVRIYLGTIARIRYQESFGISNRPSGV